MSWSVYQQRAHARGRRVYRYICRPSCALAEARSRRRAHRRCAFASSNMPQWSCDYEGKSGGGADRFLGSQPGDIQYCRYLYPTCVNISSARSSLMSNTLRSARFPERRACGSRAGWKYLNPEEIKCPPDECALHHGNAMYSLKVYLSLVKQNRGGLQRRILRINICLEQNYNRIGDPEDGIQSVDTQIRVDGRRWPYSP